MWRSLPSKERDRLAVRAAKLMQDPPVFKEAMREALRAWPISCEVNLSNTGSNRLAWLGHAGCYQALKSPEDATRQGWHYLSKEEQDEANRVAQEVIEEWEAQYAEA